MKDGTYCFVTRQATKDASIFSFASLVVRHTSTKGVKYKLTGDMDVFGYLTFGHTTSYLTGFHARDDFIVFTFGSLLSKVAQNELQSRFMD